MKTPIEILKSQNPTGYGTFLKTYSDKQLSNSLALKEMLEASFPASSKVEELGESKNELFRFLDRHRPLFQQILNLSKRSTSSSQLLDDLKQAMESKDMNEIELQLLRAIAFTSWDSDRTS
jgi:Ser/Thr protein kinase RdoA (MazF antagonist)